MLYVQRETYCGESSFFRPSEVPRISCLEFVQSTVASRPSSNSAPAIVQIRSKERTLRHVHRLEGTETISKICDNHLWCKDDDKSETSFALTYEANSITIHRLFIDCKIHPSIHSLTFKLPLLTKFRKDYQHLRFSKYQKTGLWYLYWVSSGKRNPITVPKIVDCGDEKARKS